MASQENKQKAGYLEGHFLVATPIVRQSCFEKSVVYVCVHNEEGAMGLIVNRTISNLTFTDLLSQFDIKSASSSIELPMHFGGPVEPARGFILHDHHYRNAGTMELPGGLSLTASIETLQDIANGTGPGNWMLALGYAGWGPGQLELELEQNSWITVPASQDLIFSADNGRKWWDASKLAGLERPYQLSIEVGHA